MSLCTKLERAIEDVKELPEVMDYLNKHDMAVYESAIEHVVQVLKRNPESKSFNHEQEHRKLWSWLLMHPGKDEKDYFKDYGFYECEIPVNECFACEATLSPDGEIRCNLCPLGGKKYGECLGGLYRRWDRMRIDYKNTRHPYAFSQCVNLAMQIAGLPWHKVEVQNE